MERLRNLNWRVIGEVAAAILLIAAAVAAWYRAPVITRDRFVKVPEIKETVKLQRVEVPVTKIVTIEKESAVKKLGLPEDLKADPNKQITATGEAKAHDSDTNIQTIAVMDTETGVTEIQQKEETPFMTFSPANGREVRLGYGLDTKRGQAGHIAASWQVLRLGSVYVGIEGRIETEPRAEVAATVAYRW
jgi:hypothetical protein